MCFQRKGVTPVSERSTRKKASRRLVGDGSAKQTFKKEQGVYVLTEKNFDAFVDTHPTFLAEFYAPTCIHCQALAPNYAKAATLVSIPLAKIDGSVEKNLIKQFDVAVYPTMKFWKDGNDPVDYDGGREVNDIVSWIQSHTTTMSQEPVEDEGVIVLTTANFDNFVKGQQLCLVEFYSPWCPHCEKLAPEYEKATSTLKQQNCPVKLAKVDGTVEKELLQRFEIKTYPSLKLFEYGKIADTYGGVREADAIVKYIGEKASKITRITQGEAVVTLTATNFDDFVNKNDVCLIEFYTTWCEFCKKLAPEYEKAANMLRDRNSSIKLGRVDCTVEKDLAKKYEINIYPTLKVTNRGKIFDYEGATEAESIVNYMLSVSNDTHEQRESSEKETAGESLKENIGLIEEEKA